MSKTIHFLVATSVLAFFINKKATIGERKIKKKHSKNKSMTKIL